MMPTIASSPASLLFLLVAGHALGDFPLQNAFMAEAKNRHSRLGAKRWISVLPAHALIHGGIVFLLTGSLLLGLAETITHGAVDLAKCEGLIEFRTDQIIHVGCKAAWLAAGLLMGLGRLG